MSRHLNTAGDLRLIRWLFGGAYVLAFASVMAVARADDTAAPEPTPPTAARSVQVTVTYDPAPSMSIGALPDPTVSPVTQSPHAAPTSVHPRPTARPAATTTRAAAAVPATTTPAVSEPPPPVEEPVAPPATEEEPVTDTAAPTSAEPTSAEPTSAEPTATDVVDVIEEETP